MGWGEGSGFFSFLEAETPDLGPKKEEPPRPETRKGSGERQGREAGPEAAGRPVSATGDGLDSESRDDKSWACCLPSRASSPHSGWRKPEPEPERTDPPGTEGPTCGSQPGPRTPGPEVRGSDLSAGPRQRRRGRERGWRRRRAPGGPRLAGWGRGYTENTTYSLGVAHRSPGPRTPRRVFLVPPGRRCTKKLAPP